MKPDEDMAPLGELLFRAVNRREVRRNFVARLASKRWEECVGAHLASKSAPEKFNNGTLWVAVTSASWSQELTMRKREIVDRLNAIAGEEVFQEVRFAVRPLPQDGEEARPKQKVEPEAVDVRINEPALEEVARKALEKLKGAAKRQRE